MEHKDFYDLAKCEFDYEEDDRSKILNEIRLNVWFSLPIWYGALSWWPNDISKPARFYLVLALASTLTCLGFFIFYLLRSFVGRKYQRAVPSIELRATSDQYYANLINSDEHKGKLAKARIIADDYFFEMLVKSLSTAAIANEKVNRSRYIWIHHARWFLILSVICCGVSGLLKFASQYL